MTRRKKLHALALGFLLFTTVPLLALLCRGHSPSRFAAANLPFWERQLPTPAPARVRFRLAPAPPASVQIEGNPLLKAVLKADEDDLFAGLEHPIRSHGADAGKAGAWLEAACTLGRHDLRLRAKQDRVAVRLMSDQGADGYLGVGIHTPPWSRRAEQVHAGNLRGLLAYYALTRNPAAIYTAMAAGDLLLTEQDTGTRPQADIQESDLALSMTQLYQASGEAKYLALAARAAQGMPRDGVVSCVLYEATGQRHYLTDAQGAAMKSATAADGSTPELAARLLALTGDPQYAAALNHAPVMAAWLTGVLYSRAAGGISLNVYAPSQTMIGPVHLAEQVQPVAQPGSGRKITVIVKVAHPTKFTLYVFVPADATHLSSPNHPKPTSVPADHYVVLTRRWKSGDKVILTS